MKKEDIIEIEMEPDKEGNFIPVRQYTLAEKKRKEKEIKKLRRFKQQKNERHLDVLHTNTSNIDSLHATVNQFLEGLTLGLNVLQKFQRYIR